jgi:hypothetical protein
MNSRVAGILNLVSGGMGILFGLYLIALGVFFVSAMFGSFGYPGSPMSFMTVIYVVLGIITIGCSIVCIVGGVFALKRKHWGWALAGAITGVFAFFPCGIAAIIFAVMGKDEFNGISGASAAE